MGKRNGFTLIELLAVIVILAVIALIATPLIANTIETSRRNAAIQSTISYMDTVEFEITQAALSDPDLPDKNGLYEAKEAGIYQNTDSLLFTYKGTRVLGTMELEKNHVSVGDFTVGKYRISCIERECKGELETDNSGSALAKSYIDSVDNILKTGTTVPNGNYWINNERVESDDTNFTVKTNAKSISGSLYIQSNKVRYADLLINDVKSIGYTGSIYVIREDGNLFPYEKWTHQRVFATFSTVAFNKYKLEYLETTALDAYTTTYAANTSTDLTYNRLKIAGYGIRVKPNTKYRYSVDTNAKSFNIWVFLHQGDYTYSKLYASPGLATKFIEFTTPSDARYLTLRVDNEMGEGSTPSFWNFKFEEVK